MKNIYQDDNFNVDSAESFGTDVFSSEPVNSVKSEAQRPVRPAKQAPPPIKKTPVTPTREQQPQSGVYPPGAYPQQPYYPQPIFYQGDPNQPPYPVYPVPPQPYPVYPQTGAYPVMPVAYPQAFVQAQPAQVTPAPYPVTPAPQNEPLNNEAGTRVLFQSPDFDKKDDFSGGSYETYPHSYIHGGIDVSEVELPSRKRAGTPPDNTQSPSFKIDEMEIGTYELSAMTVNRSVKTSDVELPVSSNELPHQPSFEEESFEAQEDAYDYSEEETEVQEAENNTQAVPLNQPDHLTEPAELQETENAKKPKEKLPKREIIRRTVLALSIITIAVCIGVFFNEYRLHKQNKDVMSGISDLIITEGTTVITTENTSSPSASQKPTKATTTKPTTTRVLTPSEQFEQLKRENPDIIFPDNLQIKYAKLYAQNPDFVGYLYAENSYIDFPIVQGEDDEEYIEKDFYGDYTKYGCPFMSARNNIETLDMNTVIYGHHMRDGSLFAALDQYTTLEGYKEAPVISFNTIYRDFDFKVIATFITNIHEKDDNGYVFPYYWTNLSNSLNYTAYLNQLSQRSLYDTGVDVNATDRLLTLSTCYSTFEDARLVVVARLVRPGESSEVDTSKAVDNPNTRFPQAYYDAKGKVNPYVGAYEWQIA